MSSYRDSRLGVTVGHEKKSPKSGIELYGDTIKGVTLERCIYCHTTDFRLNGDEVVGLISHVDCEKCHGPGSQHVAQARKSTTPPPFSIGKSTWDAESEIQLCGDCHRLPRSITQQELREYPPNLARFQPVGMLRSKCHLESNGAMRCTTCHSPHVSLHGDTPIDHVANCIRCHDESESKHVICPVSAKSGCIECHMPKVSQGQGIDFHDHWIRVHDQ